MTRTQTLMAGTVLVVFFLLTMGAPVASADSIIYTLGRGNPGLSGYTGPFGTVTVELQTPTTAKVSFATLANGRNQYFFGDGGSAAVNVNGDFTVNTPSLSNSLAGFSTPDLKIKSGQPAWQGSGQVDGWGDFNLVIESQSGTDLSTSILFTLTNQSGTWASAGNVLTNNASGNPVAAHIFACPVSDCTPNNVYATTGFSTSTVPDGGVTLMMLGGALIGLETLRRRFIA